MQKGKHPARSPSLDSWPTQYEVQICPGEQALGVSSVQAFMSPSVVGKLLTMPGAKAREDLAES